MIRLNEEWSALVRDYRAKHTDPRNQACHRIGIPMIAASIPLAATIVGLELLYRRTLIGRAFLAIAEDTYAARALGLPEQGLRMASYALAGVIGTLAGFTGAEMLLAFFGNQAILNFYGFVPVALGGMGSNRGAVIGGGRARLQRDGALQVRHAAPGRALQRTCAARRRGQRAAPRARPIPRPPAAGRTASRPKTGVVDSWPLVLSRPDQAGCVIVTSASKSEKVMLRTKRPDPSSKAKSGPEKSMRTSRF